MAAKYSKRKGLEGPVTYANGRVLYFDPKEQQWWDPTTDFFLDEEEINLLKQELFSLISRTQVAA